MTKKDAALASCAAGLLFTTGCASFEIKSESNPERYTILDNGRPVLTYNFGTVSVPTGVGGKYAVARGDYIHPLYGPQGEVLTRDYSPDHPHHRGVYWAWPEVTWKGETRDLHALQGIFARPVKMIRKAGNVLEAESVWKWGDREPIVSERVRITAAPEKDGRRVIDFELRFEALVAGVTLARRHQDAYGGFNLRFSTRAQQTIETQRDWAVITGIPPAGKHPVSVAIIQLAGNPGFPGDWIQYPDLNWLQPTFPAKKTAYELKPGVPLVLKYRLVVSGDKPDAAGMESMR